jgi:hypothetical protein
MDADIDFIGQMGETKLEIYNTKGSIMVQGHEMSKVLHSPRHINPYIAKLKNNSLRSPGSIDVDYLLDSSVQEHNGIPYVLPGVATRTYIP